jgi:hypothetical protein
MASSDSIWNILNQGVQAINNLKQTISAVFPQTGGTVTSATTGANGAVPAQVAGYIVVTLPSGTVAKVPYYN